jgi:hypothetical protein
MSSQELRDQYVNLTIYYTTEVSGIPTGWATTDRGVMSYFIRAHRMTTDADGLRRYETFDHVRKVRKSYTRFAYDNTARRFCPLDLSDAYAAHRADPDLDGAGWIRRTACDDLGEADHLRELGVARVDLS